MGGEWVEEARRDAGWVWEWWHALQATSGRLGVGPSLGEIRDKELGCWGQDQMVKEAGESSQGRRRWV